MPFSSYHSAHYDTQFLWQTLPFRHHPASCQVLCAYNLSYREIEEIFKERGVEFDHATLNRWVITYAPLLEAKFRKRKRKVSLSWRMDETYVKVKGVWQFLYRAVDKHGDTIDFYLSNTRDEAAARQFFTKAIGQHGLPEKVVIDKSGAKALALHNINMGIWFSAFCGYLIEVLLIKHLNNNVEQSHRPIKRKMHHCLGWKSKEGAKATTAGVELWQMIKKGLMIDSEGMPPWSQFYSLAA